jgi:sec-independent protein translocase protein TatA
MFGFGLPEMIVILVIVLVVFGPGKLPEVAGSLGKSILNFKRAAEGKDDIEVKAAQETKGNKETAAEDDRKNSSDQV